MACSGTAFFFTKFNLSNTKFIQIIFKHQSLLRKNTTRLHCKDQFDNAVRDVIAVYYKNPKQPVNTPLRAKCRDIVC
jgi:hypothetical protein